MIIGISFSFQRMISNLSRNSFFLSLSLSVSPRISMILIIMLLFVDYLRALIFVCEHPTSTKVIYKYAMCFNAYVYVYYYISLDILVSFFFLLSCVLIHFRFSSSSPCVLINEPSRIHRNLGWVLIFSVCFLFDHCLLFYR